MRSICPSSPQEWEAYYDIRFRILREPWGQEKGSERDESDVESYNLIVIDDMDRPIAVGRLHFNSDVEAQVRYMAVDSQYQSKGAGSFLLAELERKALEQGRTQMMLEARENAVHFYEKNGYVVRASSYLLFNEIQHFTMVKTLS